MKTKAIILAADQNTRMQSAVPKALHQILGKPMIMYTIEALRKVCESQPVVLIGHGMDDVQRLVNEDVRFVFRKETEGTGRALLQAESLVGGDRDCVLVTSVDMPMISQETYAELIKEHRVSKSVITSLTMISEFTQEVERIIKTERYSIVEVREGSPEPAIRSEGKEFIAGVFCFQEDWLWEELRKISATPEGEFDLVNLVAEATLQGLPVRKVILGNPLESIRIMDRTHLAQAETLLRAKINHQLMLDGVTIIDPSRTYIEPEVKIGQDTTIWPDTYIQGNSEVGENCVIGPNTIVRNSKIGNRCKVIVSILDNAIIEEGVDIGPFSHLRKGTHLDQGVHVGNFGEIKNSYLGAGTKMGHFSYIGDATVAEGVNIGAGTITCNFDGVSKQPTQIDANVFIGSDTLLVAPVRLEEGSRTGAGSVVTKDVPANTLVAGIPARAVRKFKKGD